MREKLLALARGARAGGALLCLSLLCVPTAAAAGVPAAQEGRRIRPPGGVACDLNRLTSFTGRVTSYRRTPTRLSLRMRTDEATNEQFTLRYARADGPAKQFLLLGEPFKAADWRVIERGQGRLRAGMRATVWVCEDGRTPPVVDWRPRGTSPAGVF